VAIGHSDVVTESPGASVRQRRVSAELRALRRARNLTCEQVAEALGWSTAKISRMETGSRGLYPDDVSAMLGFLQVAADLREELLALVRDGTTRNWIQVGGKVPTAWKRLIEFEATAKALYNYEPLVIPGLLQTGDYARQVLHASSRQLSETEIDHLVRTRLGRQAILSGPHAPRFSAIVDETVLRRPIGDPCVMTGQLHHLLNVMQRPNVHVRVVPFSAGAYPGLEGPMLILEFADQPTIVHVEIRGATGLLEDVPVVRRIKLAWQELRSVALSPDQSAQLVADIAGKLT
jgi:transcriptional regulator with XRE-family HTH domain